MLQHGLTSLLSLELKCVNRICPFTLNAFTVIYSHSDMYVLKSLAKYDFTILNAMDVTQKSTKKNATLWDLVGKFYTERIPNAWILSVFSFQTKFIHVYH